MLLIVPALLVMFDSILTLLSLDAKVLCDFLISLHASGLPSLLKRLVYRFRSFSQVFRPSSNGRHILPLP